MERIKTASLYIFYALLAYMPLHIFLSTWLGTSFNILEITRILKDVVMIGGFGLALVVSYRQNWFKELLSDKLVWLISIYAALTLLLALIFKSDQEAEILGVVYNLRFLVFFLYAALLVRLFRGANIARRAVEIVLAVAAAVLIFGIIQYTLLPNDALTHVGYQRSNGVLPAFFIDDKPDLERVMSTLRDPNSFGSYVIIILALSLTYLLRSKDQSIKQVAVGLAGLSVVCLYLTFSRSAWIGTLVAAFVVAWLAYRGTKRLNFDRRWLLVGGALVILTLGGLFVARDSYFVQNVILHADESTVLEDPNQLRLRFWQESLDAAAERPLGYGPGTAGLASIRNQAQGTILNENYYLQILHEVGVLGVGLFIAILVLVAKRLYDQAWQYPLALALLGSLAGLAVTNFLVHIWSNEAVAYTWWGLAGLLYTKRNKE